MFYIIYIVFTQGLTTIVNTSLLDLMGNMECNIEEIARTLAAQSFGGMIGGITVGLTNDIIVTGVEFNFAMILFTYGAVCAIKSTCTNLGLFGTFMTIEGFCSSALNVRK